MKPSPPLLDQPLSEPEQDRLALFLSGLSNPDALSFEALDGFLCAIAVGPVSILPSEYLPAIWGGELVGGDAFEDEASATFVFTSVMRHLNSIIHAFQRDGVYLPWMEEPASGLRLGQPWALGFMRAVNLRRLEWAPLIEDEYQGGSVLPIALLSGEVDPDWLARPATEKEQEKHAELMIAGCAGIYRYFLGSRGLAPADLRPAEPVRRSGPKVGRNDPCPCGSGRKFKLCCGAGGVRH
jgi:uncharacterized protein